MSLKSELINSAKFDHQTCDGRFCKLDDHPEMRAIERIAELEQQLAELRDAAKKLCGSVKETGGSVSVIGTAELVAVAALLKQEGG